MAGGAGVTATAHEIMRNPDGTWSVVDVDPIGAGLAQHTEVSVHLTREGAEAARRELERP